MILGCWMIFFLLEEKVTLEENDMLGSRFTLEEVKDGLSFFYQKYWDVIAQDLMNLFDA
jgi:hypothetical protein